MKKVCLMPFIDLQFNVVGNAYTCCPSYVGNRSIGNIFRQSLAEVWNSEAARLLRRKVLAGDYSHCENRYYCGSFDTMGSAEGLSEFCERGPRRINFGQDRECNLACLSCRSKIWENTPERRAALDSLIDSLIIPLGKSPDLREARFSVDGDPLFSPHYRQCIKILAELNPVCKFAIATNAQYLTEDLLRDLGILERISWLDISIDAATPETYKKIRRGGDFQVLLKNLELAKKLKEKGLIGTFHLKFVVQLKNFKEMPAFAHLAASVGAQAFFWPMRDKKSFVTADGFAQNSVANPLHPRHQEFLEILRHPDLRQPHVNLCELGDLVK